MIYEYTISNPNIFGIHYDVTNSEMTNKIIKNSEYTGTIFKIEFEPELSAGDKTLLDGIITDNENSTDYPKPKVELLNTIFGSVTGEQQLRIINAFDKYPSFAQALDDNSYGFARLRMQTALAGGDIIQADYDIIDGILPTKG